MPDYLFVYGTLLRAIQHPMHAHLARHAVFAGEAVFGGRMYDIGRYPGVVASAEPADEVFGELFRLNDPDAVFLALDAYERCRPEDPQPTEYVRSKEVVRQTGGGPLQASIYLYNRPVDTLNRILSGNYLER
jgi:gamma-glutamylcyclotransferase (GGCT)/AIG2-like uncharacterized protein YtfP